MFKNFTLAKGISALLLSVLLLAPTVNFSYAATTSQYQPRTNTELLAYLYGVLAQLQAQLAALKAEESSSNSGRSSTTKGPNPYFMNVVSLAPTSISRNNATLKGTVDKGGSTMAEVWFEYGTGSSLSKKIYLPDLTKTGIQPQTIAVTDLLSDTNYSFRIAAEDKDGNRQYGQTRTFTTVSSANTMSFNGRPSAETEGSSAITATGASIQGFVTMNDYSLGNVFFVYGSDRNQVVDAEDFDSLAQIPVAAGLVAKKSANAKFTGRNTVKLTASGLARGTKNYYRICVEYTDTNKSPYLSCGEVESFTTLN